MSIIGSFARSFDDTASFSLKSYCGYDIDIALVDQKEFLAKNGKLNTGKRLQLRELSGKEKVEQIIIVKNTKADLGDLTTWQVKDILDDLGFNIGVTVGEKRSSDITAAMGLGGFSIPFWGLITRFFGVFI